MGKQKVFNYLKQLSKLIKQFLLTFKNDSTAIVSFNLTNLMQNLEDIQNISLKISLNLKKMIEKKFLIQFSTLAFAIVRY